MILILGVIATFTGHFAFYSNMACAMVTDTGLRVSETSSTEAAVLTSSTDEWTQQRMLREVHEAAARLSAALSTPFDVNKSQISRGIAVYFPASESQHEKELKGFFLSIAHMRTLQPSSMKTDLLVFTPPRGYEFAKSIGCSEGKRTSFDDPEKCLIVEHIPLSERTGVSDPIVSYSRYLDSVLMVAEYKEYGIYDYFMKSDMDTFVTPAFADWRLPEGKIIATGQGGYSHTNADGRLSFIMKTKFNMGDEGRTNIGTTWYGSPAVIVTACQVSVASMRWLDRMEFSDYERLKLSAGGWPYWFWPVLSMYGGHIAINQIPQDRVQFQEENIMEMDLASDTDGELRPSVKHIHCWHTERFFSKLAFAAGTYDSMDLHEHDHMSNPAAFSAVIALSAVRMTTEEFKSITHDPERMRNNDWKRLSV
jgi:hypothetical protein